MTRLVLGYEAPPQLPDGGYVYLADFGNKVKIGMSKNPAERLRALETQSGAKLMRACFSQHVQRPGFFERQAHALLSSSRQLGEYFDVPFLVAKSAIERHEFLAPTLTTDCDGLSHQPELRAIFAVLLTKEMSTAVRKIYAPVGAAVATAMVDLTLEMVAGARGQTLKISTALPVEDVVRFMEKQMTASLESAVNAAFSITDCTKKRSAA